MKGKFKLRNWLLLLAMGFSMCSLAVSYAASISSDIIQGKKSTGKIPYKFAQEFEGDFSIRLQDNSGDKKSQEAEETLEAYFTYEDAVLNIDGVEAFNMDELLKGKVNLAIDYRMETDEKAGSKVTLEKSEMDLGAIPFFLTKEEPYWRIYNRNGAWGVGNEEAGTPEVLDKLLPGSLKELKGYNIIQKEDSKELKATIIIKQSESVKEEKTEISLSSLNLPDEINKKLTSNHTKYSTLEIMADYYFSVPFEFELDKTNLRVEFKDAASDNLFISHSQIQGVVTLRKYYKIINDL